MSVFAFSVTVGLGKTYLRKCGDIKVLCGRRGLEVIDGHSSSLKAWPSVVVGHLRDLMNRIRDEKGIELTKGTVGNSLGCMSRSDA